MKRWEHKIEVSLDCMLGTVALDQLGADGWELCSVLWYETDRGSKTYDVKYYFKRLIIDD